MTTTGQHTLTTQPDPSDSHKHCILVKLTDSSVKTIEEFLRNKNNIAKKPSISFQKDKGEINFPIDVNQTKKILFSLSSVKEQNQSASFECISFNNSKLMTIGNIEQKMTVQANVEESFKDTREKLSYVVEEEKKNSLIELKPSGNPLSRSKQSTPVSSQSTNRTSTTSTFPETNRPKIDRPIKEKLIHLLAYKPYQKATMLLRLSKITDKEKETLESILPQIATLNQKTVCYELNNEIMISEVNEDWPFYTDQERIVVKRNIAQARQKNLANANNSINNSNTSLNNSSLINDSLTSAFQPPTANRSFQKVVAPPRPASSSFANQKTSPNKQIKPNSATTPNNKNNISINQLSASKQQIGSPDSPDSDDLLNDSDLALSIKKTTKEKENFQKASKKFKSSEEPSHEKPDLSKKYQRIISNKQMEQYKNDFDRIYSEYLEAHNYLERVSKVFQSHKMELDSISDKSSREFDEKAKKIYKDYMEKLNDSDYLKHKANHEKLFNELNFIQDLINQYQSSTN